MTRNKKLVRLMAITVAATTVATSVPAYAAFDPAYYAQQNPDVVAAIGTQPKDLENHYNLFGKAEGRAANAAEDSTAALRQLFDAQLYAKLNPDVVAAYGTDANALFNHFITFGIKEGRKINAYFDVAAYKKAYPDLVNAFGDDIAMYYKHFATLGITEHRTLGGFPAEKIMPTGVAVASSDSGSSSSGGGGGSSKPAPKPAEEQVTPTPDPTPAPQPEPEPEPEPVVVPDYVNLSNSAKAIQATNAAIAEEIGDYELDGITKAQQNALVARTLTALNEADALKTQAAELLDNAKTEKKAADDALLAANQAVAEAAENNDALSNFTGNKSIVNNVAVALGSVEYDAGTKKLNPVKNKGYYGALENLALAQAAAEEAAKDLVAAQAAAAETQKAYDTAYKNVKDTYLDIVDQTEDYIATMTESQVASALAELATGVDFASDDKNTTIGTKAAAVNAYNTRYNPYGSDGILIDTEASDFGINTTFKRQTVNGITKTTNATLLTAAQIAYLNSLLVYTSGTEGNEGKFKLSEEAVEKLENLGVTLTEAQKGWVTDKITYTTVPEAAAKKLSADSDQIKDSKFVIAGAASFDDTGYTVALKVVGGDTEGSKSLADLQKAQVATNIETLDNAINDYKATSATFAYNEAEEAKLEEDEDLDEAEEAKEEADEALEEAKEALKEAETAVAEAKAERDTAYEEAGVAGNAELIARDAALEEAAKEAYELEKTKVSNAEAVDAYGDAETNYNDAKGLDPTD